MQLELIRYDMNEHRTFGLLMGNGSVLMHTLERPWQGNSQNKSCIPTGKYLVTLAESPKFTPVLGIWLPELHDVPGRSEILIHHGNTVLDSTGCILVGEQRGRLMGEEAVLSSRAAIGRLVRAMAASERPGLPVVVHSIRIRECL